MTRQALVLTTGPSMEETYRRLFHPGYEVTFLSTTQEAGWRVFGNQSPDVLIVDDLLDWSDSDIGELVSRAINGGILGIDKVAVCGSSEAHLIEVEYALSGLKYFPKPIDKKHFRDYLKVDQEVVTSSAGAWLHPKNKLASK